MIYITSYCHFGHSNVIKFDNRPFKDIQEHDQKIIANINKRVSEKDELYIVGDFAWKNPAIYCDQIRCKNIFLVLGGHDYRRLSQAKKCFRWCKDLYVLKYDGQEYVLCHYAMMVWPKSNYYARHIFGHSHGKLKNNRPFSIDIGIMNHNYYPMSIIEIETILMKKYGHIIKAKPMVSNPLVRQKHLMFARRWVASIWNVIKRFRL